MADVNPTARREHKSFCRICTGQCGLVVTVEDETRIVAVRGDKDDTQTLGYICSKGLAAPEFHHSKERLLHPLKKMPDGSFAQITLAQAFEEIGDRLVDIVAEDGIDAVASFRGSGGFFYSVTLGMLTDWLDAIGATKAYSTLTIDQSAKTIVASRLGIWGAGKHRIQESEVMLLVGANPLVSITQLDSRHPVKRIREQKARGMKLIVIDPRRTETAEYADLFVQPLPGTDGWIMAAVIREVLRNEWHDAAFCAEHVADLDLLRVAVEAFTPEIVARRADIPAGQIREIAEMFARDATRGVTNSGTGPDMGPHSNVTEHLIECLNVICGRYYRAGEPLTNTGLLFPLAATPAQVIRLPRTWESGPTNRINGFGLIGGEMATAALADDILQPGEGQVKFLLNLGGNPATCIPDQRKMVRALKSLDLMVTIDPFLTPSASLSDYILPPRMIYERPDLPMYIYENFLYPEPWTRYTPRLIDPPAGSDVCTEWDLLWYLAKRLGHTLAFHGVPLDMDTPPDDEQLLAIVARASLVPYDEIKRHPLGLVIKSDARAGPADPDSAAQFTTMPPDVQAEVDALFASPMREGAFESNGETFGFLLSSRRQRHRFNSIGFKIPDLNRAMPRNLGYMNAADMADAGIRTGDWIEITSDHGSIQVIAEEDATVRRRVISVCHGFGGLPDEDDYIKDGVSPNQLISTDRDLQTINGTPRMSGIPVNVVRGNGPRIPGPIRVAEPSF